MKVEHRLESQPLPKLPFLTEFRQMNRPTKIEMLGTWQAFWFRNPLRFFIFFIPGDQSYLNAQTHKGMSAQNFLESAQNFDLERKNCKPGTYLRRVLILFYICGFMVLLVHNYAQNYIKQNSDCEKEFPFRMSAVRP